MFKRRHLHVTGLEGRSPRAPEVCEAADLSCPSCKIVFSCEPISENARGIACDLQQNIVELQNVGPVHLRRLLPSKTLGNVHSYTPRASVRAEHFPRGVRTNGMVDTGKHLEMCLHHGNIKSGCSENLVREQNVSFVAATAAC